jgi:hypothetical protein
MKKGKLYSQKVKQRLAENLSRLRFNWWRYQPVRARTSSVLFCLCDMCHQHRRSPPSLIPSKFNSWCDECFIDLPDWLRHKKTTPEELARLAKKEKDEANNRQLKREELTRIQNARKKKKVKLTGFENVEDEEETGEKKENEAKAVADASIEKQRKQLELIFNYSDDDD